MFFAVENTVFIEFICRYAKQYSGAFIAYLLYLLYQ